MERRWGTAKKIRVQKYSSEVSVLSRCLVNVKQKDTDAELVRIRDQTCDIEKETKKRRENKIK